MAITRASVAQIGLLLQVFFPIYFSAGVTPFEDIETSRPVAGFPRARARFPTKPEEGNDSGDRQRKEEKGEDAMEQRPAPPSRILASTVGPHHGTCCQ